jgi:hypothetical protein
LLSVFLFGRAERPCWRCPAIALQKALRLSANPTPSDTALGRPSIEAVEHDQQICPKCDHLLDKLAWHAMKIEGSSIGEPNGSP